uniref:Amino acid transporter n=1 Tax=Timema genevievae TaxID=629358 RepID=A0A7R9PJG1_TIMGE|nr:unnamed protein product [Timema genevievae]
MSTTEARPTCHRTPSLVPVFFLIAGKIIEMKSLSQLAGQLGWYFSTVMLGLTIHGLLVLPALFTVVTRRLPFRFIFNLAEACTTAFGTGSSNATLPVSMKCLEEKNHVDTRVSKFMMPIGATINMDGTALYEAVAALFIAQVRNVQLSLGQILAVSVTATMASIGAAGIPQAGLVTMVMVLDTVGLDSKDVTIILAVDWLLIPSYRYRSPRFDTQRFKNLSVKEWACNGVKLSILRTNEELLE